MQKKGKGMKWDECRLKMMKGDERG